MKIVQISTVVEYYPSAGGEQLPYPEATVYGLAEDGKVYYYGPTKTSQRKVADGEGGETIETDVEEYGWRPYGE